MGLGDAWTLPLGPSEELVMGPQRVCGVNRTGMLMRRAEVSRRRRGERQARCARVISDVLPLPPIPYHG
eukprot:402822-Pyramimonas_sp.AAC.1